MCLTVARNQICGSNRLADPSITGVLRWAAISREAHPEVWVMQEPTMAQEFEYAFGGRGVKLDRIALYVATGRAILWEGVTWHEYRVHAP